MLEISVNMGWLDLDRIALKPIEDGDGKGYKIGKGIVL